MKSRQPQYEQRLVAFLDILGFQGWVDRTQRDNNTLGRLVSVIEAIKSIDDPDPHGQDKRLTQFSDSLVLSYRVTSPSAVFFLLLDLLYRIIDAAERGFLLRGGISIGQMLHTDNHVIGPAMIAAYKLEHSVALYPRVIVDAAGYAALLAAANENPASHHDGGQEKKYVRSLLTPDEDGCHFLDYISFDAVVVKAGAGALCAIGSGAVISSLRVAAVR